MSHHHHSDSKYTNPKDLRKKYGSQGNFRVKDNRANIRGYVYTINPSNDRTYNTVDVGGTHYKFN